VQGRLIVKLTHLSFAVVGVILLALLVLAPSVVFTIFAGLLGGVLLRAGGEKISSWTGLGDKAGVGIFALMIVLASGLAFALFAPFVAQQADQLSTSMPQAIARIADRLQEYKWGQMLIERLSPEQLMSGGMTSTATTAVSSTFGAVGNFVIIVFIGLYGALDPGTYRRGLLALFPRATRLRGDDVLKKSGAMLRSWLKAQSMSMAAVGILTALGLWAIGLPLAPLLGIIAALFAFIPNIGPVLAILPALSLALPDGLQMMVLVVSVYVVVQAVESYLITPLIQQNETSLPPALIIAVQVLFGALFGILGLALATPICALAIVLIRELYVDDFLGSGAKTADQPSAGTRTVIVAAE
jgi:predicted PurR-regulated permease PerM